MLQLANMPRVKTACRDREGQNLLLACTDRTLRLLSILPTTASGSGLELPELNSRLASPEAQVWAASGASLVAAVCLAVGRSVRVQSMSAPACQSISIKW